MKDGFTYEIEQWYLAHGRDLPWRHTREPYAVWVSEIIMQQTQVKQGWGYYERFLRRFPTVEALAAASEDEVMALWQGLGYYSRARNMQRAAKQIVAAGAFPRTYEGLRALSGVGDYTAAAIASLAFDLPHAVVDGNVYRVLARLLGEATPIDTTEGHRLFAALAEDCLDKQQPALYNQAIMDFGAMVCTPKAAACEGCPLASLCVARAEGKVGDYPVKARRTKVRDRFLTFVYLRAGGKVFLRRRSEKDIWQGLYEFYAKPFEGATLLAHDFRHQLSHQLLHIDFYFLELPSPPSLSGGIWVDEAKLDDYALPSALRILRRRLAPHE